jgi:hypothetical protein
MVSGAAEMTDDELTSGEVINALRDPDVIPNWKLRQASARQIEMLASRLEAATKLRQTFERLNLEGRDGHRECYRLIVAWVNGEPGAEEALRAYVKPVTPPNEQRAYLTEPSSAEKLIELQSRLNGLLDAVRWVVSDMGYCAPELMHQHSLVWHAKLSPFIVDSGLTIRGATEAERTFPCPRCHQPLVFDADGWCTHACSGVVERQ